MPTGLFGHISSNSLFQVRSPSCATRNFPNVMMLPTDWAFSVVSAACGLKFAQDGFAAPAPASGVLSTCPADDDDAPVEPGDRDDIAGLGDRVLRLAVERGIGLGEEFVDGRSGLNVRPVVDEFPDRNAIGEFRHAAEMIAVPVRGDEMIDLGQAGIPRRGHDALGIALGRIRSDIAGIDEHGFAGRRHVQRGVAAFDVDHIDVERRARLRHRAIGSRVGEQRDAGSGCKQKILPHEFLRSDRLRRDLIGVSAESGTRTVAVIPGLPTGSGLWPARRAEPGIQSAANTLLDSGFAQGRAPE